ncbi:type III pantothenate kinase [Aliikangiella maris]|uniref:Type III pantothenate kinase n=2 Tax=Aliikangiella maris TaxID=3162458 RepID=A0ABV2BZM3_9GAMM
MYLLIDWGNTNLKYIVSDSLCSKVLQSKPVERLTQIESLIEQLSAQPIHQVLVSSVRSDEENLRLKQLLLSHLQLISDVTVEDNNSRIYFAQTSYQACGVKCAYAEPSLLGIDRWLSIIAANQRQQNIALISVGTALTLDVLTPDIHLGGHILPGRELMFQSLLHTDRVRAHSELEHGVKDPRVLLLGKSTTECVHLGIDAIFWAYLSESIDKLQNQYNIQEYLITGGGGEYWLNQLLTKNITIEYRATLVFEGLALLYKEHFKEYRCEK